MRSFSAALFVLATVASQAAATIYVTAPVATTTCTAGQTCAVNWNDDGNAPVLSTIGVCDIYLATGGSQSQTLLQNIGTDDVSQTAGITFVPDATVGPNGAFYFIKFISRGYMDPASPTFAYSAFSAKFTLAGMSGTFNATIESQISGSVAAASTTAAAATTTAAAVTTTAAGTSKAASGSSSAHSTTTAKTSTSTSGAVTMSVPGVVSSITGLAVFTSFMSLVLGMLAFGL